MKRPNRLIRIPDAFIPASLLVAALLGHALNAALFFTCYLALSLLSLFSGEGLRIAFASQPSLRGVRGSARCALLMQWLTIPVSALIAWPLGLHKDPTLLPFLVAGGLFNIEHTFYEYLAAVGDNSSAALSHGLSALFLLTGLSLCGGEGMPFQPLWLTGLSLLSALIGALFSLISGSFMKGRMNARVIAAAPRAAIQSLLYPALFVPIALLPGLRGTVAAFCCGLIPWWLCRTPFRRTPSEAASMNRALLICCVAGALVAGAARLLSVPAFIPDVHFYAGFDLFTAALAVLLASLCSLALYGNFKRGEE